MSVWKRAPDALKAPGQPLWPALLDILRQDAQADALQAQAGALQAQADALQKVLQEIFQGFKEKFNIHPSSQAGAAPTIFEIFFDVERLSWEVIQEKLEYKLKLGYYPKLSALLVPTPGIALSYFIME